MGGLLYKGHAFLYLSLITPLAIVSWAVLHQHTQNLPPKQNQNGYGLAGWCSRSLLLEADRQMGYAMLNICNVDFRDTWCC